MFCLLPAVDKLRTMDANVCFVHYAHLIRTPRNDIEYETVKDITSPELIPIILTLVDRLVSSPPLIGKEITVIGFGPAQTYAEEFYKLAQRKGRTITKLTGKQNNIDFFGFNHFNKFMNSMFVHNQKDLKSTAKA